MENEVATIIVHWGSIDFTGLGSRVLGYRFRVAQHLGLRVRLPA